MKEEKYTQEYCYEKPVAPYISIEVKIPHIEIEDEKVVRYNKIKLKNRAGNLNGQLEVQFQKTPYIIYTDCVTWYFVHYYDNHTVENEISLIEASNDWHWLKGEKQQSNNHDMCEGTEVENEPEAWINFKKYLGEFIKGSKY